MTIRRFWRKKRGHLEQHRFNLRTLVYLALAVVLCSGASSAQSATAETSNPAVVAMIQKLEQRLGQVESELAQAKADAAQSRQEAEELRQELHQLRPQAVAQKSEVAPSQQDEEIELLSQKVDEQYQTKVESTSKYSVRMSGMVLLNAFSNRGFTDNMEDPSYVKELGFSNPNTSFGGTLRQTQLGFEVFGPKLFGAHASGELQFDFAGGYSSSSIGASLGVVRLRTGTVRLDWQKTAIVAGLDGLFFAPTSPTSFASLQSPAMADSGQLWAWLPQIRIERNQTLSEHSQLLFQAGLLDPVSFVSGDSSGFRTASVGERSHRPGLAARVAWSAPLFGHQLTVGFGRYQGRQDWGPSDRHSYVNSWANTLDWELPLTRFIDIGGAFHRGRALADLGGGLGQNVGVYLLSDMLPPGADLDAPLPAVTKGLGTEGGWLQVKVKPVRGFEINLAGGEENPFASELESASSTQDYFGDMLSRNRTFSANFVYRPRSNLLLSTEYRHLRTFPFDEDSRSADHVNLAVGILF